ncbi:MAG: hypothetical protein IJR47_00825 [Clostridia bacterium]|nr:hypothetical protein [Clostridia bacterium]
MNSIVCEGKEYINGSVEGVLCLDDSFALSKKRECEAIIPVIFNNHKINGEVVINCDGLIIFEHCLNDNLKEILDKIKVPCVVVSNEDARVDMILKLCFNDTCIKQGDMVLIDGGRILKAGEDNV